MLLEKEPMTTADDSEELSLNGCRTVETVVVKLFPTSTTEISALFIQRREISVALEKLFPPDLSFLVSNLHPPNFKAS